MTPLDLAAGEPSGRGLGHLEFGDGCFAQLVNLGKPRPWRRNHFAERSEPRDERLRQRFDVPAGQRAKQHKLEKLVIAGPIAAGLTKTRAQTLAMAVIMWWRLRATPGSRPLRFSSMTAPPLHPTLSSPRG